MKTATAMGLTLLLAAGSVAAEVRIERGWVRAVPPVSSTTAGYARLVNRGASPVVVEAAPVHWAGEASLHEMAASGEGTRTMRHLDRVTLAPGETLELAPGGRHLMFTELERVPEAGQQVPVCFHLNGERRCQRWPVRRSATQK